MILAIDIGNTHITAGCIEDTEILHVFRLESDPGRTEYEYAVTLRQILDFYGIDRHSFEGAVISSVVPTLTGIMKAAVKLLTGVSAIVVGAGIKTGLNIKIDNPAQLGSDLVVGAVAALYSYEPPLIVVDLGTATTFTVIDGSLRMRGGAIVPGVSLSLSALASGTSQLPNVPIEAPKSCIGTNTIDCMKSGAVFGAAAVIDGLTARMEAELGQAANIIATGGLARVIIPHCRREIIYDEDLLLRGLAIIYKKNKK